MMATCMQCGGSFNVNQQLHEANVELARLRAECERLRADWARASRRVGILEKELGAPKRHTGHRLNGKQVNSLLAAGLVTAAQHKELKAKTGHTAAKRIWRAGFETGLAAGQTAAAALKEPPCL